LRTLRRRRNIFLSLFFSQNRKRKKKTLTKNMWWIHFDMLSVCMCVFSYVVLLGSIHTVVNHAAFLFVSQSSLVSTTPWFYLWLYFGSELGTRNKYRFSITLPSFFRSLSLALQWFWFWLYCQLKRIFSYSIVTSFFSYAIWKDSLSSRIKLLSKMTVTDSSEFSTGYKKIHLFWSMIG